MTNPRPLVDRFWSKVEKTDTCWLWMGARTAHGYGHIRGQHDGARAPARSAHRIAYELTVGAIPAGLQLDHLCRIRHCVNPAHLEPVTARVNNLRGASPAARNAALTHCPAGHNYDEVITYPSKKGRRCRACHQQADRRYRARQRAMRAPAGAS